MNRHAIVFNELLLVLFLVLISACQEEAKNGNENLTGSFYVENDGACYEIGELFAPPDGIIDPWRLDIASYCCSNHSQQIVVAEPPVDGHCQAPYPLKFKCIHENGDRDCDAEENFCTSPQDCPPPDDSYQLCCGEGDLCPYADDPVSATGVTECCTGLEGIRFVSWLDQLRSCTQSFSMPTICVKDCGDGECTIGENFCTCPEDCEFPN